MKKNNYILSTLILLGLALAPLNTAFAENNLVQLDLKKGSGNAVDITFLTTESYGSSVIVRKKSDNKYVILMPKVLTSGYRSADLASVRDLVSNIDVKSINDGAAGYTKITLITTKPLNITTHVAKAAPLSDAQKEYKTLIAEAYSVKNSINKGAPTKTPRLAEVTVNKLPAETAKPAAKPQQQNKPAATTQVKKEQPKVLPVKVQDLKVDKKPENKIVKKVEKAAQNIELAKHTPDVPTVQPKAELPTVEQIDTQPINDIKEVKNQVKEVKTQSSLSLMAKIKNKVKNLKGKVESKMPTGLVTTLGLALIPILALIILIKVIHTSLISSRTLKKSFLERIAKRPRQKDYEHIINNENLNWQEKYQLYMNQASKSPAQNSDNKYKFVTQTQKVADSIEEQRQKLERLVTPEKPEQQSHEPVHSEDVKVHSETQVIGEQIKQSSKIKAFEPSLNQARRNVKYKKSRFTRFATKEDYQTSPIQPVEMKNTALTQSNRQAPDANLKVSDVIKPEPVKDDYVMSSLDEFFATPESNVAATLAQIKPSMKYARPEVKQMSNPIEVKKPDIEQKPTFSGLIVKTGCNIDEDRGFYIVNLDGTSALVGRIREDVVVLKKFDDTSERKLQVRHDKDTIYMVKTEGFKSLIDANNMGVLVEL